MKNEGLHHRQTPCPPLIAACADEVRNRRDRYKHKAKCPLEPMHQADCGCATTNCRPSRRMKSGLAKPNETIQRIVSNDERTELKRGAGLVSDREASPALVAMVRQSGEHFFDYRTSFNLSAKLFKLQTSSG
jgi:hypothetical protein